MLIYNNQVSNPITQRMLAIAKTEKIPVVGINEMMPNDLSYVTWVKEELQKLESALKRAKEVESA